MIPDTHTRASKRRRCCVYSFVVLQLLLLPLSHAQQTSDARPSNLVEDNGIVDEPCPAPLVPPPSPERLPLPLPPLVTVRPMPPELPSLQLAQKEP